MTFEAITPEKAGISSEKILSFLKMLEDYRMQTHSVLMARGDGILAECYYRPFHENFHHRMYSISKSFVSVAVGLAYTEGLLKLEDKVIDYFPEYRNEHTDALYDETTIEDMLTMRSNITGFAPWWGVFQDRIESYYTNKSGKIPGTLFCYDSVGSALLGCIVERLTGKNFLEYLKQKVLLELGFSKDSYVLYASGGYAFGDSGVMCTTRDLLIFARFVMNLGLANGRQYIDREYMKRAISKQSDNDVDGGFATYKKYGYGYLIWKAPDDGFTFLGMGDQIAICDVKRDFIFIITADNQADSSTSRALIFHALYNNIIYQLANEPLKEDADAYKTLQSYIQKRELLSQYGDKYSALSEKINGVTYELKDNAMRIKAFKISLSDETGVFEFEKEGKIHRLEFGLGKNVFGKFPGDMRNGETAGELCPGQYDCAASAAWTKESTFVIKAQIIDTYFGCLNIYLGFKDERVSMLMKKSGQYVLDGFGGYAMGGAKR